jgi:hypothetical protein
MYRRQRNADKSAHRQRESQRLLEQLYDDPKTFWNHVQRTKKNSTLNDVTDWTKYFKDLLKANESGKYYRDSLEMHCAQHPFMYAPPDANRLANGDVLNTAISYDEVVNALKATKCGKSHGADGIPMEFLRQAFWEEHITNADGKISVIRHFIFAQALVALFNKVLHRAEYPAHWAVGTLVPVPKPKGNPNLMDDYRGITVGMAISKLYALVIMMRIDAWAEQHAFRAEGQFGFRHGRGTAEAILCMRHAIETSSVRCKPLYAAFIDFKKAYDKIDRKLLWACMHSLGIHGSCLQTLRNMYEDVRIQIRMGGQLGLPFNSDVGVKQGDPLSPLLFGLFIDRFEQYLADNCDESVGIEVAGKILNILLYADDLVLLADNPKGLQAALAALEKFCGASGMTVNVGKSEVVIFNSQYAPKNAQCRWHFGSDTLTRKHEFVYLGVKLSDGPIERQMLNAMRRNLAKGRGAMGAMMQRCKALRIHNPHIMFRLFDALVMPILSYGCEIWGPDVLAHYKWDLMKGEVELMHRSFMRMIVGTCKATPVASLMRQLDRQPIMLHWVHRAGRFIQRVANSNCDSLMYRVLMESQQIHLQHKKGWYNKATCMIQQCSDMKDNAPYTSFDNDIAMLDMNEVMKWCHTRLQNTMWAPAKLAQTVASQNHGCNFGIVRACPDSHRNGFKLLKYERWFTRHDAHDPAKKHVRSGFTYCLHRYHHIRTVARFMLGVHWLNTEKLRTQGIPRSQRLCPCCSLDREDELHVFMCPAYQEVRPFFPAILGIYHALYQSNDVDKTLREAMAALQGSEWTQLADFLCITISIREKFVIPQLGGTN